MRRLRPRRMRSSTTGGKRQDGENRRGRTEEGRVFLQWHLHKFGTHAEIY
jgi:hypothetical protein